MVKILLTMKSKVNMAAFCSKRSATGDVIMKNAKPSRGFWSWLMGSGWGSTGSNG